MKPLGLTLLAVVAALTSIVGFATVREDANAIRDGERDFFTLRGAATSVVVGVVSALMAVAAIVSAFAR